jgi:hypothetical protein
MPTTRRKSAIPHSAFSQTALSFKNKPSRITKPSIADATSSAKKSQSKLSEPAEAQVFELAQESTPEPQPERETTEIAIRESPRKSKTKTKLKRKVDEIDDARVAADKVTDDQLMKYWKAEEDARLAPRGMSSLLPPLSPPPSLSSPITRPY